MGDEAFPLKKYLLRPFPVVSALNDESKQIYNYRLLRARRVVENAVSFLTQKFRLFCDRIQLSPKNTEKVVLAACVLHSYLRNDVSVQDCVIENTVLLRHNIFRSGGSASEEAMRVSKEYRRYFENVRSVPRQLEAIRRGRTVSK